ncbi:hypothetical protein [Rhodobium gokarnense]|uniref:F5/8 type C domain-containing protein n=1 Tax=Rhodobium gokarnense TaxID=364296 RepID=A0ABT3HHC8_9HYPH|nr:hypothetical protein [Rhodobium gokarnense]MCW2309749.1 hypothetical protein [Rhodobium gokarnense]
MANAAIVYSNLADGAAVSAPTQVILAPAANVQDQHVGKKWRSRTALSYLTFDFGATTSIDTIAAIGLTASTVRLRISTSDSTGAAGDLYDSMSASVDQNFAQAVWALQTAVSGRYLRIDLAHSSLDYVEVGRVVAGVRTAFGKNFGFGWSLTYIDRSVITETRGGQTQITPENTYRAIDLTFSFLTDAEQRGFVDTVSRSNALKTDVLLLLDPDSSDLPRDTVWGLMTESTSIMQPDFGIFSKQLKIKERL